MRLKSSAVLKSLFGANSRKAGATSLVRFVALTLAAAFITATSVGTAQADPKYAGIVIDAKTGKVLYGEDPDGLRYPASLTKMMTLYLTFEALNSGRISLDPKVPVSANAAKEPPSSSACAPVAASRSSRQFLRSSPVPLTTWPPHSVNISAAPKTVLPE